jgi:diphthamide synthase (EF-2-diphthine--ammonia ligase)
MSGRPPALIAWSSGKDSAWALHETRRAGAVEVVGALTISRVIAQSVAIF